MQTIKPCNIAQYYPKKIATEMTAFNAEVEALRAARAKLAEEAGLLRQSAALASLEDPLKLPSMVDELRCKQCALDVDELRLLGRKTEFKTPVIAARSAEKKRLAELSQKRYDELAEGLQKLTPDSMWKNGVITGDRELRDLKSAREAVSSFFNVVTEADEERGNELSQRLAGLVPSF